MHKPDGVIETEDFAFTAVQPGQTQTVIEPDKTMLESAMREHEGVIARVAREFGMSRQALYRRLNKFGIEY